MHLVVEGLGGAGRAEGLVVCDVGGEPAHVVLDRQRLHEGRVLRGSPSGDKGDHELILTTDQVGIENGKSSLKTALF